MKFPHPPSEHPRLFLRQSDLDMLRRKAQHPAMLSVYYRLRSLQHLSTPAQFDTLRNRTLGLYGNPVFESIKASALFCLLDEDEHAGRIAVEKLFSVLKSVSFTQNPLFKELPTRAGGELLVAVAVVYDWCYNLLTDSEKQFLWEQAQSIISNMECHWPPISMGAVSSHSGESQLMRDIIGIAIAFYDEHPELYEIVAPQLFDEFVPLRNYVYQSHAYHQGCFYGTFRYEWEIYFAWICRRMGFGDVFSPDQQYVPYSWIYTRLPDGQLLKDGDSVQSTLPDTPYWSRCFTRSFMLAASYYRDPYLQGEYFRCDPYGDYAPIDGACQTVEQFLFYDPELASADLRNLPLSRLFGYPCGNLVARNSFDLFDPNTVVASFKIGQVMFKNHQHRDCGHFQIFYRDMLALDSGLYESSVPEVAYRSDHRMKYLRHTIAHNCMVFPDSLVPNDHGGQLCDEADPHYAGLSDLLADPQSQFATLLSSHVDDQISWASVDLTRAYGDRVKHYVRSFVFIATENSAAPAIVIVYDYAIPARKTETPIWLLHTQTKPELESNGFLIINKGKLKGHFLTRNSVETELIGGPGHEFDVFGTNYPGIPFPVARPQEGNWRIQIRGTSGEPFECVTVLTVCTPENDLPPHIHYCLTKEGASVATEKNLFHFKQDGSVTME